MKQVPTVMGAIGMDSSTRVLADGNSDVAIPGDIVGTDAKSFRERFPVIEDPAPFLRCRYTGVMYPNQAPFNQRSDILEPCWGELDVTPPEPVPVEAMAGAVAPSVAEIKEPYWDKLDMTPAPAPVPGNRTVPPTVKRGKSKRTRTADAIEVTHHHVESDNDGITHNSDSDDDFSSVAL